MRSIVRRFAVLATTVLAASAVLAGCGNAPASEPAAGELQKIRVGVLPNIDVSPIYLGAQKGFFAAEGLELELVPAQSGAAVVPSVISGDMAFGFSNAASLITAAGKGLPIRLVTAGVYSTGVVGEDFSGTVTMPGRGISSVTDLAGRSVAVTSLGGSFTLTLRYLAEEAGIDSTAITFVELPAAETPAALQKGTVDAAVVGEPFLSELLAAGAAPVVWNYPEIYADFMISAYFTSTGYAESNPSVIEGFRRAVTASFAYAGEHPDEARATLATYTELSPEAQERVTLPRWSPEISVPSLELLSTMLVDDGQLEKAIDPGALVG